MFTTVPFETESNHGLTQVKGMAKVSPAGIVFEFEPKFLGLISGGVKEVRLPAVEILDIKFKKGFWRRFARIVIRPRSVHVLSQIPNNDGRVVLKLKSEDFEAGRSAVEQLNEELERIRTQTPPPQMPISSAFIADAADAETKEFDK